MNRKERLVVYGLGMSIALFLPSSFITGVTFVNTIDTKGIVRQDAYTVEQQLLQLSIKDINVSKMAETTATVRIIFGVHNPQGYTVLSDGIDYNIYANNETVSSGEIGSEDLLDIMREEPEYPIISNDTVTLKDSWVIHTNEVKNDISNIIIAGKACFMINGTYFYRLAGNFCFMRTNLNYFIM